jgi:hypothetical protein
LAVEFDVHGVVVSLTEYHSFRFLQTVVISIVD